MNLRITSAACLLTLITMAFAGRVSADDLHSGLVFLAPFDEGVDATIGADRRLYTAESLKRENIVPGNHRKDVELLRETGRYGGALRFNDGAATAVTMFRGTNMSYSDRDWSGTVSMWLRLSPDEDLRPGYCDPLQITDKTWNDAAFFVDFDKDLPRVFRLGVFPDYRSWNPMDTPWEKIPVSSRPMVAVSKPPFKRTEWTHVAWTFTGLNIDRSVGHAELYVNGRSMGRLSNPMKFSWQIEKTAIMLGIAYTGDFDELAIYNRPLTAGEIEALYRLPNGLAQGKK